MSSLNEETYAASLISQEDSSPPQSFLQRYFSFTLSQVILVLGSISLLFNASYGLFLLFNQGPSAGGGKPGGDVGGHRLVVVNTWWPAPANASMNLLLQNFSALDAVVAGCISAEENFAYGDHTVGPNGSPDTTGETTLDALLGDGSTMDYGVVSYLRRIPSAILAAKAVMTYTRHTVLSGDGATALASAFGGQQEGSLTGNFSQGEYQAWEAAGCQPNYYASDWVGGANTSCPPYAHKPMPSPTPLPLWLHAPQGHLALGALRKAAAPHRHLGWATPSNHDTLGICAMDASGSMAVGVTSNGANHKVAGRVGDAPIVGAGGYASNDAGCAAVTGDGDITQRFLPAFVATENMKRGMSPQAACEDAVRRIMKKVDTFAIGIVCLNGRGEHSAAGHGWAFKYCSATTEDSEPQCHPVIPLV